MNIRTLSRLFFTGSIFYLLSVFTLHAQNPETGKAARYCNPLPMVIGPGGNDGPVFKAPTFKMIIKRQKSRTD